MIVVAPAPDESDRVQDERNGNDRREQKDERNAPSDGRFEQTSFP